MLHLPHAPAAQLEDLRRRFQRSIARRERLAHREIIARLARIRIDTPRRAIHRERRVFIVRRQSIAHRHRDDLFPLIERAREKVTLVLRTLRRHARRRRAVAAAQTRHPLHRHVFPRRRGEVAQQFRRPRHATRHVPAHAHRHLARRRELEMREKTRHALQPVKRHARILRKPLQRLPLEIPVLLLNADERRHNDRRIKGGRGSHRMRRFVPGARPRGQPRNGVGGRERTPLSLRAMTAARQTDSAPRGGEKAMLERAHEPRRLPDGPTAPFIPAWGTAPGSPFTHDIRVKARFIGWVAAWMNRAFALHPPGGRFPGALPPNWDELRLWRSRQTETEGESSLGLSPKSHGTPG